MFLLFETSMGYALFKVDEQKFNKISSWQDLPQDLNGAKKLLQLQDFKEFQDAQEVLKSTVKLIHGKLSSNLKKFLKENIVSKEIKEKILVSDKNIAQQISNKLDLQCINNEKVVELQRIVRLYLQNFLGELKEGDLQNMSLGLAHGLGRFKIKFSSDKIDIMIMQAVNLYEDLDKEINNYLMRLKEWYGYHFPELTKIVIDGQTYTKVIQKLGLRENYENVDLTDIVGEELNSDIKTAAEISMGTEINEQELGFIQGLVNQIIELFEYRDQLEDYLKNWMNTVAPNLSLVLGEVIAAKMIAKAGSLINLAKCSASTIQIMGAEKALFKAIKTKAKTPKYGIIYQSKMISNLNGKAKGKISRALAAKSALCVRYDALTDGEVTNIGHESREYLEKRILYLEKQEQQNKHSSKAPEQKKQFVQDWQNKTYSQKGDVKYDNKKLKKD